MADTGSATPGKHGIDCGRPLKGPNAGHFPNVVVVTHENRRALFYDDLLCGKLVIVNFMSVKNDARWHVSENLAKVQLHLGGRLGQEVFIYSITVDPLHDTPQALGKFAERHGAQPGWSFLTGAPKSLETLRGRFFGGASGLVHGDGEAVDCCMRMLRYGNEAVGLWGSVPSSSTPEAIAMRVSWVATRLGPTGPPKRGGPMPLESTRQDVDEER